MYVAAKKKFCTPLLRAHALAARAPPHLCFTFTAAAMTHNCMCMCVCYYVFSAKTL